VKVLMSIQIPERPGNYLVLAIVADFFDGIYQIRPAFRCCVYPLLLNHQVVARPEDIEKGLDEETKRGGKKNKYRQYWAGAIHCQRGGRGRLSFLLYRMMLIRYHQEAERPRFTAVLAVGWKGINAIRY